MQALNYSAQAVVDIREFAGLLGKNNMPYAQHCASAIADRLEQSIKFILPDGGYLFDHREAKQSQLDLLHLPYPCIAAEYFWGSPDGMPLNEYQSTAVPKRIALSWDTEMMGESEYFSAALSLFNRDPKTTDFDGRGTVVWPIDFLPDLGGKWLPSWAGVLIPAESRLESPEVDDSVLTIARTTGIKCAKTAFRQRPLMLGEIGFAKSEEIGDRAKLYMHFESAVNTERMIILQLCSALNCTNVKQDIIPAPKALNKKRASKGKPPFFEYRILTLDPMKTPQIRGEHQGGTHAAPRVHLRRGHIRRLPKKAVWVQPCVVGNKKRGVVVKDYALSGAVKTGV